VQTNIVVLDVSVTGWTSAGFVEAAAAQGIRLYPVSPTAVRLVWHLDVDDAGTDKAVAALVPLLEKGPDAA
jgi:threonine aldolase